MPMLDITKLVAWDLETSGTLPEYALQPWRMDTKDSWITSTSMIRHDGTRLVPDGSKLFPTRDDLKAFLERALADDLTIIGWNIPFDIGWLFALGLGELAHQVRWLDAMLLWRHLTVEPEYDATSMAKRKSYSLKAAVPEFIPHMAGYEDDVDFHATDPESLAKLQKYNDRDSVFTWVLGQQFWSQLTDRQRTTVSTEAESLSLAAEANYTGMPVDTLAARELAAVLTKTAAEMLEKLSPHGVTEKIVRSPVQLAKLMFDEWGLSVLKENTSKLTGKTTRSTDKEVLHELAFTDDRCADLRRYREALGNKTKFADTPLLAGDYNGDGRARPSAIVFGTYSGRLTYGSKQGKGVNTKQTGFALHQEKRGAMYRGVIVAPPGHTLMEFDASGQEFRWMAVLAGDQTMMQLCLPGEDPHSFMGSRIVGTDYQQLIKDAHDDEPTAKNARQLGKVANLGLGYRTGPKKLRSVARVQYLIPMELPEAQRIHRTYRNTYKDVPKYWDRQIAKTKQLGYVETLSGRRVQVIGDWDGPNSWSMESTSLNYPVQGVGADQKYLALKVIKPYLTQIGAKFAWDLHDGIYLWVPDDKVSTAAVDIKRLLDNLPYNEAWGFTPPIPLPWDAKAGKSWGSLEKLDV